MQRIVLSIAFVCLAFEAHAHTQLAGSTPAEGTSVSAPLAEIVLEFAEPVRLTAVVLTDAAGVPHALAPVPSEVAARFVLAVRADLQPGEYSIAWRCVGADTHIVSGDVPFVLTRAAP